MQSDEYLPLLWFTETSILIELIGVSLHEVDGGYTFFWIGTPETAKREAISVMFAIRNDLVKYLVSLSVGINKRYVLAHIVIGRNKYASIFSCYVPSIMSNERNKENFSSELHNYLRGTSIHVRLLSDFNARVVSVTLEWSSAICKHGVDKAN